MDADGKPYRTRTHITDITQSGFHYSQDLSHDGGVTWELGHLVMEAKRATAGGVAVTDAAPAARNAAGRGWPRALVWLQLAVGWLPILALYTALIFTQHQPVSVRACDGDRVRSLSRPRCLGILVYRFAKRVPWPRPFRMRFALIHLHRRARVRVVVDPRREHQSRA